MDGVTRRAGCGAQAPALRTSTIGCRSRRSALNVHVTCPAPRSVGVRVPGELLAREQQRPASALIASSAASSGTEMTSTTGTLPEPFGSPFGIDRQLRARALCFLGRGAAP